MQDLRRLGFTAARKNTRCESIPVPAMGRIPRRISATVRLGRKPAYRAAHFYGITSVLEEKAANADEKASILLDRGVSYAKLGIGFMLDL